METQHSCHNKANKGGTTVTLSAKNFTAKTNEQVQDNSLYQKLNLDQTVNSSLENFRNQELLSNSTTSSLTLDEVRTPQFHILPKVYKPNILERPALTLLISYK